MAHKSTTLPRIIIVCGHFGSGKTNVAVALAKQLAAKGQQVALADLDIINPYFRAADNREELEALGIRCILPPFANTNLDLPVLTGHVDAALTAALATEGHTLILDVGGDSGAAALGRYRERILSAHYAMLCVCSCYRPLTATAKVTAEDLSEIESYAKIPVTHLVNNSNLGAETTPQHIADSLPYIGEVSAITGLPVAFHAVIGSENAAPLAGLTVLTMENATKQLY